MKRVILALPGLLCAVGLCMAQNVQSRRQTGTATQEMRIQGLSAAHSRLPIGSKAKVTNPANGLEIEVTITGQIAESPNRIIDLSPSAARALEIGSGGPVVVAPLNQPILPVDAQGKQPFYITINNYANNPDKPEEVKAEPVVEPPPSPPPLPPEAPPVKASLFTSPPVSNPQVIPGLPSPHSNKVYRLLVGSYSGVDNTFRIYQQLQAAGFQVIQEQAGEMSKVFAAGIPASMVYYAVQRLGAIGFQRVWIQE